MGEIFPHSSTSMFFVGSLDISGWTRLDRIGEGLLVEEAWGEGAKGWQRWRLRHNIPGGCGFLVVAFVVVVVGGGDDACDILVVVFIVLPWSFGFIIRDALVGRGVFRLLAAAF